MLYDHDDSHALAILKAAHAAMEPGATLLIAEPMADAPGAERMGATYFGLYLLAMKAAIPAPPKLCAAWPAVPASQAQRQSGRIRPC